VGGWNTYENQAFELLEHDDELGTHFLITQDDVFDGELQPADLIHGIALNVLLVQGNLVWHISVDEQPVLSEVDILQRAVELGVKSSVVMLQCKLAGFMASVQKAWSEVLGDEAGVGEIVSPTIAAKLDSGDPIFFAKRIFPDHVA